MAKEGRRGPGRAKSVLLLWWAVATIILALLLHPGVVTANVATGVLSDAHDGAMASPSSEEHTEPVVIRGRIATSVPKEVLRGLRVTLNGGQYTTLVRKDGSFLFPNRIAPGVYTLDALSPDFLFSSYKLDTRIPSRIRALSYHHPGADREMAVYTLSYGLMVEPILPLTSQYFVPRPTFNWGGLLKNPMVLMGGFMMLMMFGMPYLMGSLDEEEMKKMQEQYAAQQAGSDPSQLMANLFGGGGKDDSDDEDDDDG